MLLVIFAHPNEAKESLLRFKAEPQEPGLYRFDRGYIAVTGMGCFAALSSLLPIFPHIVEIWNLGFCGALKQDLPIGSLYPIAEVEKHLFLPPLDPVSLQIAKNNHPLISLPSNGKKLITTDCPIHDPSLKATLNGDLVDMEGYAIAYAAERFNKPCRLWKVVSDFASPHGRDSILRHSAELSHLLAHHLNLIFTPS